MNTQTSLSSCARKAGEELFTRYDKLNDLWKQTEERLTKYHIPRSVSYTYASYYPDDECEQQGVQRHNMLGLQKVKGSWRICSGECDDRWPDSEHWTPITECSALHRVQTVKHLPGLEEAIVENGATTGYEFDYMVHAVGFGLRYRTPVGPIRLDLAYSVNPPRFIGFRGTREELLAGGGTISNQRISGFQFHFSLGQRF